MWTEECLLSPPRDLHTFPHSPQTHRRPGVVAICRRCWMAGVEDERGGWEAEGEATAHGQHVWKVRSRHAVRRAASTQSKNFPLLSHLSASLRLSPALSPAIPPIGNHLETKHCCNRISALRDVNRDTWRPEGTRRRLEAGFPAKMGSLNRLLCPMDLFSNGECMSTIHGTLGRKLLTTNAPRHGKRGFCLGRGYPIRS